MSGKLFVLGIPSEGDGGNPMRLLASVDKFHELAFRIDSGKFIRTPTAFMYLTTPHRNEERMNFVRKLHTPDSLGRCVECHWSFPCRTVRLLNGEES